MWNQACPDQKRHTLLWVTTATLNCLSSASTDMAPLSSCPSKLSKSLLNAIFLSSCRNKTFDWLYICILCFIATSLFLIVKKTAANVFSLNEAVAASTSSLWLFSKCLALYAWDTGTKLSVVAWTVHFGLLVWNSLWCGGVALALTCGEAGCKGQIVANDFCLWVK